MPQYVNVEIDAETVVDAMAHDGNFALEMWMELTRCIDMGALLDDACDIATGVRPEIAAAMSSQFIRLGEGMRNACAMSDPTTPIT